MLKQNICIGFFSPSYPITAFAPTRFQRAITYLESKGLKLKAGSLTSISDHYRSGTILQRAEELNALIKDPEVDIIMSTIGGSNSTSLLPYIDYEAYRKTPKPIVGYSDVTAILLAIYTQTGISTYYGPALVASFGELAPFVDQSYQYFSDLLIQVKPLPYVYSTPRQWTDEFIDWETQNRSKIGEDNQVQYLGVGRISGRVIGGNLNTISAFWGSPYMPTIRVGDILLIEDSLKDIATVERLLAMLKLNQVFDRIAALIVGKHEALKDLDTARTTLDVLLEILNGQELPIVYDFDCGHTHPMYTIPIGAQLRIDFDCKEVSVLSLPTT